jgi:hypothetical protein
MKPGNNGELTFEFAGELDVLNAGLDVILDAADDGALANEARHMRQISRDLTTATETVIAGMAHDPIFGDTLADAAPKGMALTFEDPRHVQLARLAVTAVAANAPGTTGSRHLQDPLIHDTALGMAAEYERISGHPISPLPPKN